jgi:hemolysin activation/secretion protein
LGISFYQSFKLPAKVTFAWRIGGGLNSGRYELYQAQILDGKTELRGFRKTRFYGDSKVFSNAEVRLKLASIKTYLFPASVGINAFYDVGRVWYKDETGKDPSVATGHSTVWHQGIGGGIWFTPMNLTVLSTEFAHSRDGNMVYIRLGFLF